MESWSAATLAHGATALVFFRYRAAVFGQEEFCYGVLDHATPRGEGRKWREAQRTFALARAHAPLWLAPLAPRSPGQQKGHSSQQFAARRHARVARTSVRVRARGSIEVGWGRVWRWLAGAYASRGSASAAPSAPRPASRALRHTGTQPVQERERVTEVCVYRPLP